MMKKLLIAVSLLIINQITLAEQINVNRLHVTSGQFNINSPIGQNSICSNVCELSPFILESGSYQGSPGFASNSDFLSTFQFAFFGPVFVYTAPAVPSAYGGGPAPIGFVDDASNTITMDMSSWFAWWNGIDMGQGSDTATGSYNPDTGEFILRWSSPVIGGPFDGTIGYWQLSGLVETDNSPVTYISADINIHGGVVQECQYHGGHFVQIDADINSPISKDEIAQINWTLDGKSIGTGLSIYPFITLGSHTITMEITTVDGSSRTFGKTLGTRDTKAPEFFVGFVDANNPEIVLSEIFSNEVSGAIVKFEAHDLCDPDPITSGVGGFAVKSRDVLQIKSNAGQITLPTNELTLKATATDASDNTAAATSVLKIVDF